MDVDEETDDKTDEDAEDFDLDGHVLIQYGSHHVVRVLQPVQQQLVRHFDTVPTVSTNHSNHGIKSVFSVSIGTKVRSQYCDTNVLLFASAVVVVTLLHVLSR